MPVNVGSCQGHAFAGAATANIDVEVVGISAEAETPAGQLLVEIEATDYRFSRSNWDFFCMARQSIAPYTSPVEPRNAGAAAIAVARQRTAHCGNHRRKRRRASQRDLHSSLREPRKGVPVDPVSSSIQVSPGGRQCGAQCARCKLRQSEIAAAERASGKATFDPVRIDGAASAVSSFGRVELFTVKARRSSGILLQEIARVDRLGLGK